MDEDLCRIVSYRNVSHLLLSLSLSLLVSDSNTNNAEHTNNHILAYLSPKDRNNAEPHGKTLFRFVSMRACYDVSCNRQLAVGTQMCVIYDKSVRRIFTAAKLDRADLRYITSPNLQYGDSESLI